MRYLIISTLFSFLFLTSCANRKIRFVRDHGAQKVVAVEEHERTTFELKQEEASNSRNEESSLSTTEKVESSSKNEETIITTRVEDNDPLLHSSNELILPEPTDTIVDRTSTDEVTDQALQAEDDAENARLFYIISLALFLFISIIGVIFFFVGNKFYRDAANSRYITKEGDRVLNQARKLRIANIIIYIILLILLIAAITVLVATF